MTVSVDAQARQPQAVALKDWRQPPFPRQLAWMSPTARRAMRFSVSLVSFDNIILSRANHLSRHHRARLVSALAQSVRLSRSGFARQLETRSGAGPRDERIEGLGCRFRRYPREERPAPHWRSSGHCVWGIQGALGDDVIIQPVTPKADLGAAACIPGETAAGMRLRNAIQPQLDIHEQLPSQS